MFSFRFPFPTNLQQIRITALIFLVKERFCLPDVVATADRTFCYNRIKPASVPVCLLGSTE
jgi:hypothetical protein